VLVGGREGCRFRKYFSECSLLCRTSPKVLILQLVAPRIGRVVTNVLECMPGSVPANTSFPRAAVSPAKPTSARSAIHPEPRAPCAGRGAARWKLAQPGVEFVQFACASVKFARMQFPRTHSPRPTFALMASQAAVSAHRCSQHAPTLAPLPQLGLPTSEQTSSVYAMTSQMLPILRFRLHHSRRPCLLRFGLRVCALERVNVRQI
jgi:hypothetical protein